MKRLLLVGLATLLPVGLASAADLPRKAPPKVAAPVYGWSGFYGGFNAGYLNSHRGLTSAATPVPDATRGVIPGVSGGISALSSGSFPAGSRSGFIGGGQIGYNHQLANAWVAGIEADIQGIAQSSGSATVTNTQVVVGVPVTSTTTASEKLSYLGTLRGRLGWLATPMLLVYGTGGLAYGGVKASESLAQTGTNGFAGTGAGGLSEIRVGWALGGGLEWMLASKWSAKVEYFHYDLGTGHFA